MQVDLYLGGGLESKAMSRSMMTLGKGDLEEAPDGVQGGREAVDREDGVDIPRGDGVGRGQASASERVSLTMCGSPLCRV